MSSEVIAAVLLSILVGFSVFNITNSLGGQRAKSRGFKRLKDASLRRSALSRLNYFLIGLLPARALEFVDKYYPSSNFSGRRPDDKPVAPGYIATKFGTMLTGFIAGYVLFGGSAGFVVGLVLGFAGKAMFELAEESKVKKDRWTTIRLMPDFLNLVVIGVDAGLSFDRMARLYCGKFNNPLSEMLADSLAQIQIGESRKKAFERMAQNSGVSELSCMVNSILQAEQLGVSLANALRVQAEISRENQHAAIKEVSATAPIKMLFPIAGLILPSLFIVLIGPVLLQFLQG